MPFIFCVCIRATVPEVRWEPAAMNWKYQTQLRIIRETGYTLLLHSKYPDQEDIESMRISQKQIFRIFKQIAVAVFNDSALSIVLMQSERRFQARP